MSKLDDLIKEKCPNGVKYEYVGSIADVGTGSSNGNEAIDNGEYPFFVRSQTVKAKNDYEYDEEAIIIPGEGGIGDIYHYVNGKYALHQRVYRIHFKDDRINTCFMYYCFSAFFKRFILKKAVSATVTSIRKPMIEKFEVPVPPLEVQNEIVQILDNFAELTAELTAELSNRKKQYEYYRDLLLNFDENEQRAKYVSLGDCCKMIVGGDIPKDAFSKTESSDFRIPILSNGIGDNAIYGYTNRARVTDACVTFSARGTIGYSALREKPFFPIVRLICAVPDINILTPKYLYYVSQTLTFQVPKSGIPQLTVPMLSKYKIPIPSLEEQNRIAQVLERFDKITTDISEGLPAEIEAREKQYAYYRDKLLSFKELVSNV